jgi:hypothetical protein
VHFALASKNIVTTNYTPKAFGVHKLISANLWQINKRYNLADFRSVNQIYELSAQSGLFDKMRLDLALKPNQI